MPSPKKAEAPAPESQRDRAIELALGAIEKQFGKGSIMRLDKQPIAEGVKVVPTGSIGLDIALGVGGLPRGRIVEIYGPESSGKTTLTLHAVAEAQKRGGVAAFIDAEHALDVGYARKLGVKTDELLVSQPDCGEQALEIADMLVRSNAIDVNGRYPRWSASPAHESGPAEAHRRDFSVSHHGHLHQPDPHEDRRHVRQPGDHDRR